MIPSCGLRSLLAPLLIAVAIAGFALVAAPAASAKTVTPKVTELQLYRTPSGPQKGALTVIATADFRGAANNVRALRATRSLAKIIVTLTGARRSITVSDTVRITQNDIAGSPVRFDIRVPQSMSRLLSKDKRVRIKATLTRKRSTTSSTRLASATTARAQTSGWRCGLARANGFTGSCMFQNVAPPAPPVGFEQWQNGGPAYWSDAGSWVLGGDEALVCVRFYGGGYGSPNWYSIGLNDDANSATIGYVFAAGTSTVVAANGSFSFPSYLDQWVGGYAQVTTGPQLSGTVPTSILSGPVSSSTGPATLNVSPQAIGLPVSWTLGALTANQAAGVC